MSEFFHSREAPLPLQMRMGTNNAFQQLDLFPLEMYGLFALNYVRAMTLLNRLRTRNLVHKRIMTSWELNVTWEGILTCDEQKMHITCLGHKIIVLWNQLPSEQTTSIQRWLMNQRCFSVYLPSIQRWFNVLTLNQRWIDVVSASYAHWDMKSADTRAV